MGMNSFRRKLFFRAWIILCMLLNAVTPQDVDDNLTACEIESLLKQIMNPSPEYQMHAASLRNQLRNLLLENEFLDAYQGYQDNNGFESDYVDQDKRSVSSLARSGLLQPGKRYVGALARSGMLRSPIDEYKRSLATLAKNGQLPSQEPDAEENSSSQWNEKRNLGSLARSGYFPGKRNIGALARDYQLPSNGKRNLASLARLGFVPSTTPKRNIASLARFNSYTNKREANYWSNPSDSMKTKEVTTGGVDNGSVTEEKRNIGALKNSPVHGTRQKRDLYSGFDENLDVSDPMYQPLDYEEIKDNWDRVYGPYFGDNLREGKRFLGSVARSGWYQSDPSSTSTMNKRNIGSLARLGLLRSEYSNYGAQKPHGDSYRQQEQKRHIGALARSGWLPSFRPVRSGRFSRSGRARSRIVEYFPQQERLRQPIAAVCRRCDESQLPNSLSWGAPGLQSWGTPPRLTALHWRSLRPTGIYSY